MSAVNSQFAYLVSAELTDIGLHRKNNEDAMIRLPEHGVFCVADGMGGVQGGAEASQAIIDALKKTFRETPEPGCPVRAEASAVLFERALHEASHWIKARADSLGMHGSGSTVVGLMFEGTPPARGLAMHAGDSRAYRLRDDRLVQLTEDHSVATAAGLPDDSTLPQIFRGVITRAVGLDGDVHLDVTPFNVEAEDVFLLCSDGLDKMLSDRRIKEILCLHRTDSPGRTAKCLVDAALQAGGHDNVTVIVIRVGGALTGAPDAATGRAPGGWLNLLRPLFPFLKRRIP